MPPKRRPRRDAAPRAVRKLVENGFAKPREAAQYLGIGKKLTYGLIHDGTLSHVRHGRRISIPWESLREYAAQRLKPGSVA